MPRCPDCNKFVSIEMADPEVENVQVSSCSTEVPESQDSSEFDALKAKLKGGVIDSVSILTLEGSVRLVQTCADCGTELAEANTEIEDEVEFVHKGKCEGEPYVVDYLAVSDDRYEGKGRYARHYYGATVTGQLRCDECGAEAEKEVRVEEQASYFESLV